MLKEVSVKLSNASIVGDPRAIREYVKRHGAENFIIYGFPGFLVAESLNEKTAEKMARIRLENVAYFEKPLGTIYSTYGKKDSYTVTDGLNIAILCEDAKQEDINKAVNEITERKSYFIGHSIAGNARNGVFAALASYYSNLLTSKDIEKYPEIFRVINGDISLTEKGDKMLELLKETWDYTPKEIRSLCKMEIKYYLYEVFKDLDEGISVDIENLNRYVKSRIVPDALKKNIEEDVNALRTIIDEGMENNYFIQKIHDRRGLTRELKELEEELRFSTKVENKIERLKDNLERLKDVTEIRIDAYSLFENILDLAPAPIRPSSRINEKAAINVVRSDRLSLSRQDIDSIQYTESFKDYRERIRWRKYLEGAVNVLRTRISEVGSYGISPVKQLEMLEKGGYVTLYEGVLERNMRIFRGQNFRHLNDLNGTFCPMGLSDKWDTWKIERSGPVLALTKYFRNAKGELLRISADTFGNITIDGKAEPVFDEATRNEINSLEEIINYRLPLEERMPLKWDEVAEETYSRPEKKQKQEKKQPDPVISAESQKKVAKKQGRPKKPFTKYEENYLLKRIKKY